MVGAARRAARAFSVLIEVLCALSAKRKRKPRRNDTCPCGSGTKFKRCHGGATQEPQQFGFAPADPMLSEALEAKLAEVRARQIQREQQQGLGRPIIAEVFRGHRFVAVAGRLYYSKEWRTFHDFLLDYIGSVLGSEWRSAELAKPEPERHPLLRLYGLVVKFTRQQQGDESREVYSAPMTGAILAYLGLAYNLYLLSHNATLHDRLIKRLKDPGQFHGAVYETYVAAAFIKAGCVLALEDESDTSTSHCEFSATSKVTGRAFSVEAKARLPGKSTAHVSRQLGAALKKRAAHPRVVFIDVNVPAGTGDALSWFDEALGSIRRKEATMIINGRPAPEAYVVLTNHPYQYQLETLAPALTVAAEGFKIPTFKADASFRSIREALAARKQHRDIFTLMESMRTHYEIPSTFDGEIPEFAFGEEQPRLRIGSKYLVPGEGGAEVVGTLVEATVIEPEAKAYGIFRRENGDSIIVTCDLSPEELSAYRRHPDTFFGVHRQQGKRVQSPLEFFDCLFETYSKTPKEKLLEFMKDHPDIAELERKDQRELATLYCERMTEAAMWRRTKSGGSDPPRR